MAPAKPALWGKAYAILTGMKSRNTAGGYTILEVMIVLVVTAALFAAVAALLSGKQATTEFNQAVRDYESKVQSVASQVAAGFYTTGSFNCNGDNTGNPVTFSRTVPINAAGANISCLFMGKMMTAGTTSSDIFTMAGRQYKTSTTSGDVVTIDDAKPVAVYDPGNSVDVTESFTYKFGLTIKNVYTINGNVSTGGFGFLIELGGGTAAGSPVTGSRGVLLYSLANNSAPNVADRGTNAARFGVVANLALAPGGIRICLTDGGTHKAEITVGANGSQTSTEVTIDAGISAVCQNA